MESIEHEYTPEIDVFIQKIVYKFNSNTFDADLLSEARLTALGAINQYNKSKQAKLRTYLYRCILNKLIDIKKLYARRESLKHGLYEFEFSRDDWNFKKIENDLDMKKILGIRDYAVYLRIMGGYTLKEIAKELATAHKEIEKCFRRITRVLVEYEGLI